MNTGDWIIFEYRIVQIKEAKDGRVTSVSDGQFETSGYDLSDRCFPLTLANKNAADYIESYAARVHREGGPGLNLSRPALQGGGTRVGHHEPARRKGRPRASIRSRQKILSSTLRSHPLTQRCGN